MNVSTVFQRPEVSWRAVLLSSLLMGLAGCVSQLKPEAPSVLADAVSIDTVKRGPITVQTVGLGRLRPTAHGRFRAALLCPAIVETDLELGQAVAVQIKDTIVSGKIEKIQEPNKDGLLPVDVSLPAVLPKQARDGFPVSATVEMGRLDDVLYVGRPAFGQINSTVGIFKIDATGTGASRVPVRLGKGSMTSIQILGGLNEGDRVIISDMSRYDSVDTIAIAR